MSAFAVASTAPLALRDAFIDAGLHLVEERFGGMAQGEQAGPSNQFDLEIARESAGGWALPDAPARWLPGYESELVETLLASLGLERETLFTLGRTDEVEAVIRASPYLASYRREQVGYAVDPQGYQRIQDEADREGEVLIRQGAPAFDNVQQLFAWVSGRVLDRGYAPTKWKSGRFKAIWSKSAAHWRGATVLLAIEVLEVSDGRPVFTAELYFGVHFSAEGLPARGGRFPDNHRGMKQFGGYLPSSGHYRVAWNRSQTACIGAAMQLFLGPQLDRIEAAVESVLG